jgi:hypothetical protein
MEYHLALSSSMGGICELISNDKDDSHSLQLQEDWQHWRAAWSNEAHCLTPDLHGRKLSIRPSKRDMTSVLNVPRVYDILSSQL